jgi:hypothetical protein
VTGHAGGGTPGRPARTRERGAQLTLLVRAYCHLCDEMATALAPLATAHGATVAVIDVDADPALETAFGDRVPVLFAGAPAGGTELCHHRLDHARVVAALAPPAHAPALRR